MRLNLLYLWRSFAAVIVAVATFGLAPGAMAGVLGSATLDITNGQFSYSPNGTGTLPNNISSVPYYELATGNFAYTNTLPSASLNINYSASAVVDVNGGSNGGGQSFWRNVNLGYTSLNALMLTPNGQAALGLVTMFSGPVHSGGPATFMGYNFSWMYNIGAQNSNSGSGTFMLWSAVNYSGAGNPGGLIFPASASFTAKMAINAVPEPGMLGLLGFGLLMVGLRSRKKITGLIA